MKATWWEHWRHRISGAWDVLTGRAWPGYGDPTEGLVLDLEMRLLLARAAEHDLGWHRDVEAFMAREDAR